jgi:hypothetical protein
MFSAVAVSALAVLIQTLPGAAPFPGYGEPLFGRSKTTPKSVFVFHTLPVETPKPEIVCGIRIIRGNADVDPKIVMEPRKGVDYKIRIIEAPACH